MILGICLSFPKMGSSLNSFITPKLAEEFGTADHMNVAGPIMVGCIIMSVSLVLAVGTPQLKQCSPTSIAKANAWSSLFMNLPY
jgi:hypothetical protein